MNYNEILSTLKEKIKNIRTFAFEDFNADELGLGPIDKVHEFGGEGQGDRWYIVYYFVEHDVYIEVDGYYSSENGVDFWDGWGSCSQVIPVEKTITVYKSI